MGLIPFIPKGAFKIGTRVCIAFGKSEIHVKISFGAITPRKEAAA
jgi:hypothetical protein